MSVPTKAPETNEIMTLDEVATYLKVTTRTIYRMLEENQIPAFKIRSAWRFRKDEIEKITKQSGTEKVKRKKTGGR